MNVKAWTNRRKCAKKVESKSVQGSICCTIEHFSNETPAITENIRS